ncbi:Na+/H+ antiporter NhaA [Mycolicibacter sinensis]|uniref:Na(+)/H(+) antiporter NhaA n=1 Tax=Mycolicibacter sinensis (strain JDM601) TaxID=875328 RepID=A0A1A3U145_MYCSD|nr:Na+/H+ antiporter NhaA [Mycolicibacter sinensis]
MRRALSSQLAPGSALLVATAAALVWANFADQTYTSWWGMQFGWPRLGLHMDARHWVNDALMTVFFFVIGLELKQELTQGELANPRRALVPAIAAVGGAVVPAGIFVAITWGTDALSGWGVPMATDPAFAVGILALVAPSAPAGLRAMLLAIATVDDVLAVLVIAFGYARGLAWGWLAAAVAAGALVVVMRRRGVIAIWPYLVVGAAMWFATLHSGVHATIAGVVLALLTPVGPVAGRPVLADLLRVGGPVSAFVAVPVFALANAGLPLGISALSHAAQAPVFWAVLVALVGGKLLGVSGAIAVAVGCKFGQLPAEVRAAHVLGLGCIAGLGFTVALFVTDLAYTDSSMIEHAKIGVFAASLVAAGAAAAVLAVTRRRTAAH